MKKISYNDAVLMVENGAKVWHVLAKEGVCYVIATEMPEVKNAYVICELSKKHVKRPRLYDSSIFYNGWFWWAVC